MTDSAAGNGNPPSESGQPLLIFMPSGRRGHVPKGKTVLEAARELGVEIEFGLGLQGWREGLWRR